MSRRKMQLILAFVGAGTALIACLLLLGIGGSSEVTPKSWTLFGPR